MVCHVILARDGTDWTARCREYPECSGRGASREESIARLRASVLFSLEACPCDVTADSGLELQVVETRG